MPKMKTNRAAAKRFKVTGTGKALRRKSNLRHGMISMNRNTKRRKGSSVLVAEPDQPRVLRLLGKR